MAAKTGFPTFPSVVVPYGRNPAAVVPDVHSVMVCSRTFPIARGHRFGKDRSLAWPWGHGESMATPRLQPSRHVMNTSIATGLFRRIPIQRAPANRAVT